MRVVVEEAPANAARILRIRSQLVMNPRVPNRMLGQPLHRIRSLRRKGVPDKLRIQIRIVVRWFERPAEVVHGEDVFEKFGVIEVANAAGRPAGVELVRYRVRPHVEVVIVLRLVDPHAPGDDRRMVPVAANHTRDVVDRDVLPGQRPDVLPAGNLLQHQQSNFIAGIQKMPRLRIMRGAYDIAA